MNKRKIGLAISLVAIVAAVTALLVAGTATSAGVRHMHPRPSLSRHFSVLHRYSARIAAASSASALPSNVEAEMTSPLGSASELGLEPAEADYVRGRYENWVVPGSNGVCLVSSGIVAPGVADAACTTPAKALAEGIMKLSVNQSGEHVLTGLVPNGNSTVTITGADGGSESVEVTSNVYEVVGASASVSFKDAGGTRVSRAVPNP